ncbi:MAG: aminotransferase class III-fold pyridoxal phosphate-dependent enzyme [Anaerolineae bacterium]
MPAAVVTTPEAQRAFDNGAGILLTLAAIPVACAAGLAVLDVLEDEGPSENARTIGELLIAELNGLMARTKWLAMCSGSGPFLVDQKDVSPEPAAAEALMSTGLREEGHPRWHRWPFHNVSKLRPPLIFNEADAHFFCGDIR